MFSLYTAKVYLTSKPIQNAVYCLNSDDTFCLDSGDSRPTSSLVGPLRVKMMTPHREQLCVYPEKIT